MVSGYTKFLDANCLQVPSRLLWRFCLCLCCNIQQSKDFYFKNQTSLELATDPQQTLRLQSQASHILPTAHSHTQSVRLSLVINAVGVCLVLFKLVCLYVWAEAFTSAITVINFKRTPFGAKALMKRKSPPHTPHPIFGSLSLSCQWHTLGDCANLRTRHTTFSTQHCWPSNSICFPLSLAAFICMREMSRGLRSMKKRSVPPPCTWRIVNWQCSTSTWGKKSHSLCTRIWVQVFT